jgi:hypothetical protein
MLTGFTKPKKIQLMIDHLITCGFRHLFGPIRNITKIQFDHIPALLADDMVMVTLQLTELIFYRRPIGDFKNDSQGLEKIKGSVDRGQPDFFPLFEKVFINFQRTQRANGIGKLLINQKPGMAQTELLLFKKVSKKRYIHDRLRK